MSTRNIVWLTVVVALAVIGAVVFDAVLWGVLIGLAGLVVSEVTERTRRRRRAAAAGEPVPKPLRGAVKRSSRR